MRWPRWLDALARDVRHAVRGLRRSPGHAAMVVVVLALGIGASTAMFGIVHGMLLRPPPYPHGERLVRLGREPRGMPGGPVYLSAREIERVQGAAGPFEQVAAYGAFTFGWVSPDGSRPWGAPALAGPAAAAGGCADARPGLHRRGRASRRGRGRAAEPPRLGPALRRESGGGRDRRHRQRRAPHRGGRAGGGVLLPDSPGGGLDALRVAAGRMDRRRAGTAAGGSLDRAGGSRAPHHRGDPGQRSRAPAGARDRGHAG